MYDVEANNKSVKANNNRYVIFGEEEIIYILPNVGAKVDNFTCSSVL